MKKRYLIPSLLLLASTSLTACGGSSGLITNGQPYSEGQARAINPSVQAKAEDSFNKVTMKTSASFKISETVQGRSDSMSISESITAVVDIENKTIEYTIGYNASGMGSQKIVIKAQEVNGEFVITSGSEYSTSISSEELSTVFDQASYQVYSWNYTMDEERLNTIVEALGDSVVDIEELEKMYNDLNSSLVFVGDISTGTFDVGLSKAVTLNISDVKIIYNKMKYSFKEGLLRNGVAGLKLTYAGNGVKLSLNGTISFSYSYSKGKSSASETGPLPF